MKYTTNIKKEWMCMVETFFSLLLLLSFALRFVLYYFFLLLLLSWKTLSADFCCATTVIVCCVKYCTTTKKKQKLWMWIQGGSGFCYKANEIYTKYDDIQRFKFSIYEYKWIQLKREERFFWTTQKKTERVQFVHHHNAVALCL